MQSLLQTTVNCAVTPGKLYHVRRLYDEKTSTWELPSILFWRFPVFVQRNLMATKLSNQIYGSSKLQIKETQMMFSLKRRRRIPCEVQRKNWPVKLSGLNVAGRHSSLRKVIQWWVLRKFVINLCFHCIDLDYLKWGYRVDNDDQITLKGTHTYILPEMRLQRKEWWPDYIKRNLYLYTTLNEVAEWTMLYT